MMSKYFIDTDQTEVLFQRAVRQQISTIESLRAVAEAANMAYAANQHRSDTWVKSLGDALVAAGYEDTRKDKQ
jgi:hypothetical protein